MPLQLETHHQGMIEIHWSKSDSKLCLDLVSVADSVVGGVVAAVGETSAWSVYLSMVKAVRQKRDRARVAYV